jgi:hypothetical protein
MELCVLISRQRSLAGGYRPNHLSNAFPDRCIVNRGICANKFHSFSSVQQRLATEARALEEKRRRNVERHREFKEAPHGDAMCTGFVNLDLLTRQTSGGPEHLLGETNDGSELANAQPDVHVDHIPARKSTDCVAASLLT